MSKSKDVMIDLETMGTGAKAAIISIGAVRFSLHGYGEDLGDTFYATVSLQDSIDRGFTTDEGAIRFWMDQPASVREDSMSGNNSLFNALEFFKEWLPSNCNVWGNGTLFDNRLMREAYDAMGEPCPWHYRSDRDMRTFVALARKLGILDKTTNRMDVCPREGDHHNALSDAKHQARIVQAIFKKIVSKEF